MRNCQKVNFHVDDLQRVNNYDNIPDIIFIGNKSTTKIEIILTKSDAGFTEK